MKNNLRDRVRPIVRDSDISKWAAKTPLNLICPGFENPLCKVWRHDNRSGAVKGDKHSSCKVLRYNPPYAMADSSPMQRLAQSVHGCTPFLAVGRPGCFPFRGVRVGHMLRAWVWRRGAAAACPAIWRLREWHRCRRCTLPPAPGTVLCAVSCFFKSPISRFSSSGATGYPPPKGGG